MRDVRKLLRLKGLLCQHSVALGDELLGGEAIVFVVPIYAW